MIRTEETAETMLKKYIECAVNPRDHPIFALFVISICWKYEQLGKKDNVVLF